MREEVSRGARARRALTRRADWSTVARGRSRRWGGERRRCRFEARRASRVGRHADFAVVMATPFLVAGVWRLRVAERTEERAREERRRAWTGGRVDEPTEERVVERDTREVGDGNETVLEDSARITSGYSARAARL